MKIENYLQKIGNFFSEVKEEMKKVSWLTWRETWEKTLLVIGVSVATAIFLGGLDMIFSWIRNKIM